MIRTSPLWVPRIRLLRVLWRLLRPAALGLFLVAAVRLLGLPEAFHRQAGTVLLILVVYGLLLALAWEILAPFRPELRLVPVTDARARRLSTIVKWILLLVVGVELALYLLEANAVHSAFIALIRLLRNAGLVVVAWLAASRSGLLDRLLPEAIENARDLVVAWILRFVVPFAVLTLMACLTMRALGYLGLAKWTISHAGWTAIAVVAVALLHWWVRRWQGRFIRFMRDAEEAEPTGEAEEKPEAQGWIAVDRTLRPVMSVAAVVGGVLIVVAIWGIDRTELVALLSNRLPLGSARTWIDLVEGAAKIFLLWLAYRVLVDLLVFVYFPRRDTDVGMRYAIITVLKYAAIFVGVVVGAGAVGLDMSAVTIFAGGAGVGLSFALKDILGNFFSGLILLFERPVRVGDLIEVGGVAGQVEAIRLRGTVIRAWDQSAVIIPNTQMIGERLTNLTQERKLARLEVPVGVSYGSDLQEVEQVLLNEAKMTTGVIEKPAPFVRLTGFGDSSVDMQLFCFTDQIGDRYAIQYELRKNVFAGFTVAGITIPFPQRDVHMQSDDA